MSKRNEDGLLARACCIIAMSFTLGCTAVANQIITCEAQLGQLREAASKELSVGSSDKVILGYLQRHKIKYSFDRFLRRYQGIFREVESEPGVDCAVQIYIYVDKDGAYSSSEFVATFTGP